MSVILRLLTILVALRDLAIRKGLFTIEEYNEAVVRATGELDQSEARIKDELDMTDLENDGPRW